MVDHEFNISELQQYKDLKLVKYFLSFIGFLN